MKVLQKLDNRINEVNSLLCVGPDPDMAKLPTQFLKKKHPQYAFSKWIIDQVAGSICAFKPNIAFYEARVDEGLAELKMLMEYIKAEYPQIFTICDAKRGDIDSTNKGYVTEIFDWLGFDAVTVHPYLGKATLMPFLERDDKVSIILCRTSTGQASEFQDLKSNDKMLWEIVAEHVAHDWNQRGNCMLVAGATYPKELAKIRKIVGDMTILVPGIGAQGGDVAKTVKAGLNSQGKGMMINSSRGVIFSPDPKSAAEKLRTEINQYR